MEQKETEEGNKLIAEFMERHYDEIITDISRRAPYHNSWQWLMPVVDKIESQEKKYYVTITKGALRDEIQRCIICDFGAHFRIEAEAQTKLEATWLAVIQFIKNHNSQPTKNNSDEKEN